MTPPPLLHPYVDPTHAGGLWDPSHNQMPFFVKAVAALAVVFLVCLLGEIIWIAYKLKV